MESYLPENEYKEFEGRLYGNPQVSLDETNTFIDNLRSAQGQQNQEIITDTKMLGTDVPSDMGGLTGADSYFTSRYQTPQTNSVASNLRATAQAAALNQVLQNEQDIWKKRYQEAYRDYQKRASTGGGGGGGDDDDDDDVVFEPSDDTTLTAGENEIVLPENKTDDVGAISAVNAYAGALGQGKAPTTSSVAGILVDKDGNRTAIRVYPGKGIEVAGGQSYTKSGARSFLSEWVRSGGKVLNYLGGGNYSTNMIAWDLY